MKLNHKLWAHIIWSIRYIFGTLLHQPYDNNRTAVLRPSNEMPYAKVVAMKAHDGGHNQQTLQQ